VTDRPEAPALEAVGLRPGDRVRWRPKEGARWAEGTVTGRERDGSIGLHDRQGRARALALDRLEVRTTGRRGARTWEAASERAARTEQLDLF
jgi:hypothetical protein